MQVVSAAFVESTSPPFATEDHDPGAASHNDFVVVACNKKVRAALLLSLIHLMQLLHLLRRTFFPISSSLRTRMSELPSTPKAVEHSVEITAPLVSNIANDAQESTSTTGTRTLKQSKKVKKLTKKDIDEVLMHDIVELRGHNHWDWDPKTPPPFQNFEELDVTIGSLAQSGDGLALLPDRGDGWVLAVPFVIPGEKVRARVYRHNWYGV